MDRGDLNQKIQEIISLICEMKEEIQSLGKPNSVAIMSGNLESIIDFLEEIRSTFFTE